MTFTQTSYIMTVFVSRLNAALNKMQSETAYFSIVHSLDYEN